MVVSKTGARGFTRGLTCVRRRKRGRGRWWCPRPGRGALRSVEHVFDAANEAGVGGGVQDRDEGLYAASNVCSMPQTRQGAGGGVQERGEGGWGRWWASLVPLGVVPLIVLVVLVLWTWLAWCPLVSSSPSKSSDGGWWFLNAGVVILVGCLGVHCAVTWHVEGG